MTNEEWERLDAAANELDNKVSKNGVIVACDVDGILVVGENIDIVKSVVGTEWRGYQVRFTTDW